MNSPLSRGLFISEYPYKFTSELTGKDVVEDDHVEFKIELDEEDGDVKWYKDGVEIIPDGKRIQIVKVRLFCQCHELFLICGTA